MRALSYLLRALIITITLACALMPYLVDCIVIQQVKFETLVTGRTDYAFAGESLQLTSQYVMKDDAEFILEVKWFKDGKLILEWDKYRPGMRVMDIDFKGHVGHETKFDHVILSNVTLDMHGEYKCRMRTDLNTFEHEGNIQIISPRPCTIKDWSFSSEPDMCREYIRLSCLRMFPRPSPSCGLYDSRTGKLIEAVSMIITEEPKARNFRVEYYDMFDLELTNGTFSGRLANMLDYAGHLVFKCDLEVRGTSWKHTVEHKMFDFNDGCEEDPLDAVKRLRAIVNQLAQVRLAKSNHTINGAGHREFQHLEDADMITANMKYELISPNTLQRLHEDHKHGGLGYGELQTAADPAVRSEPRQARVFSKDFATGENLNCWQKPRLGTVARLSCGSSMAPLGDNTAMNPVKLSGGSNLLQCRTSGWVPIRESDALNNEILDHSRTYKAVLRKKSSRLTTTITTTTTTTSTTQVIDLSPDSSSSSSMLDSDDSSATAEANNTSVEFGLEPPPDIPASGHVQTSFEERTKVTAPKRKVYQWVDPDLAPTQIAKLLPTCKLVSTKRRHHHNNNNNNHNNHNHHHHHPNKIGDHISRGGGPPSATGDGHPHLETHASQRDGTGQKWYTFSASSSSSPSSSSLSPAHMRSLFTSMIVSSLVFIVVLL